MRSFTSLATPLGALALLPLLAACNSGGSSLAPASIPAQSFAAKTAVQSLGARSEAKSGYTFTTYDNQSDPTFNQLLGINDNGTIAGYYGVGTKQSPNKGYTLAAPYGASDYTDENFPGSVQTQVTGINGSGNTVGFWVDKHGNNFGFTDINGTFTSFTDPATGTGTVNQLLGINDHNLAVGFYVDGSGNSHGYELNLTDSMFTEILPPAGGSNLSATGIDDQNDVTGFYTNSSGTVVGFLYKMKKFTTVAYPNAMSTEPFGINEKDEIVGTYVDSAGATHGFTLTNPLKKPVWTSIDNPNGVGVTFINGVNDAGDLVGFYMPTGTTSYGFLATKK
jgi:hypothetical protein